MNTAIVKITVATTSIILATKFIGLVTSVEPQVEYGFEVFSKHLLTIHLLSSGITGMEMLRL